MSELIYENTLLGKELVGIKNKTLELLEASNSVVDKLVIEHHYSHKTTKNRFFSMLVNNGLGFIQLGYGIRPKMKHTITTLIDENNFCEFDRMWLSDELPKNTESQVISLLLTYIKNKHPNIKFVITYADGSVGNTGTIYKASNAISIGSIPVDFYILSTGERVHPVSMYHRHKSRAKALLEELYPGIKHIKGDFRQYRFLYILNKAMRKKFQAEKRYATSVKG